VLPGVVGTIQATEAIKLVLGIGETLAGRLLLYDALKMRFRSITLPKDRDCPLCGVRPSITSLRAESASCAGNGDSHLSLRGKGTTADMTVTALKARIDAGTAPVIVDVREPWEAAVCRIPGALLIPLGELARRTSELDPAAEIVVHCKSGGRSARAVGLLRERGCTGAVNLAGGILSWINEIDPSLPSY